MTSNLIINYQNLQKAKISSPIPNLSTEKPQGKIIRENIFQSASSNIKDYGDCAKFMYNAAIKGEGKDYSVGKINDLTLRLGSLAIAGVLATSKLTPVTKGMEFVGLATWFAGMALWPKVMGAPIKWMYGVDINQKYQNSEGDRKRFFLDAQYLPWDLYSDEEINKIGDKLRIPKNIDGRREAIQNKMKQVAIQSNTLAMLTAGFTTPVIASALSDKIEKHILTPMLSNYRISKAEKNLTIFDEKIKNILDRVQKNENKLTLNHNDNDFLNPEKILIENPVSSNKINPEELNKSFQSLFIKNEKALQELSNIIGNNDAAFLTDAQVKELKSFFENKFFGSGAYGGVSPYLEGTASFMDENTYLIDEAKINLEILNKNLENGLKSKIWQDLEAKGINPLNILDKIPKSGILNVNDKEKLMMDIRVAINDEIKALIQNQKISSMEQKNNLKNEIGNYFNAMLDSHKIYEVKTKEIKELFNLTDGYVQLNKEIDKYKQATIKNVAESLTAKQWGEVPGKFLNAIGLNKNQISELATNRIQINNLLTEHFEKMSEVEAQKAMNSMIEIAGKAITNEEKALAKLLNSLLNVKKLSYIVAKANNFDALAEHINIKSNLDANKLKIKVMDTKSSFIRPIKALDVFSRDIKGEFLKLAPNGGNYDIAKGLTPEKFADEVSDYVKDIVITNNDVDNWTNKMEKSFNNIPKGVKERGLLENIAELTFGKLSIKEENNTTVKMINKHNQKMKRIMLSLDRDTDEILKFMSVEAEDTKIPFKFLATISGKDVTNFFVDAAQKVVGNKKYWNSVGKLSTIVVALSAIAILRFGRKNNVNLDAYKTKQGEGK